MAGDPFSADPFGIDIAMALVKNMPGVIKVVLTLELDCVPLLEVTTRTINLDGTTVMEAVGNYKLVPVLKEDPS